MDRADILIYVEDPGAANYAAVIPEILAGRGASAVLLAGEPAMDYLRERGVRQLAAVDADAEGLLMRIAPRLLVVGTSENPRTLGFDLLSKARSLGLPSVGLIDSPANASLRFRGETSEPLCHAPDWLAVPDEFTKQAFAALGFREARIRVCGHPHYDKVMRRAAELAVQGMPAVRREMLGIGMEREVAVFVAELSTGLDPNQYRKTPDYTLQGRGESIGRTEIVIEEVLDAVMLLPRRPYLVLRLHPKNSPDDFMAYMPEFDAVSQGGDPLGVVYSANLAVGMSSMLMLEAALMGVPTLSILPRQCESDWLPPAAQCLMRCETTRRDLRQALGEMLSGKGLARNTRAEMVPEDSARRVADLLLELAG